MTDDLPILRDGSQLIVPRGITLPPPCIVCGEPVSGQPLTKHLRTGGAAAGAAAAYFILDVLSIIGLVLDLIFIALWLIDLPASRRRRIGFGLCASHKQRHWQLILGAWAAAIGGVGLIYVAIFVDVPFYIGLPASIFGLGLMLGATPIAQLAPTLAYAGQNPDYLWVTGAGAAYLARFPQVAPPR